jgi:hypothetical protein
MKIIILVLTYDDGGGYSIMDKCIKSTWGQVKYNDIEIFYYYAKPLEHDEYVIDGNNIICKGHESYNTIGYKTIKAFKALINKNFDFLLRTNSSSFIHIDNLLNYLKDKPKTKFYSGAPIPYHTKNLNMDFATGSGYILSKDLVELVVNNEEKWDHYYPDDVSIGKLMKENDINFIPKDWMKITTITDEQTISNIKDTFHIRCKIETAWDNEGQCIILKKLYNLIYENFNNHTKFR